MKYSDPDSVPSVWNVGDIILDRYEVKQVFTGGGMGLVYRVHHLDWNIDLAVKCPRPEFFKSQQQIEDFEREAETWVNLGLHPHAVSCYYVRRLGGIPRIFAEFVNGGSLADWVRSRKLYVGTKEEVLERIFTIAIQFAWGLNAAHERGIVHQDVKPANVLMTARGTPKITDFGLAKARSLTAEDLAREPHEKNILVTSGGLTPAYCSPEQIKRQRLSLKTDLWSWAITVFEMFLGEPPCLYGGQTAPHALEAYLQAQEESPDTVVIPECVALLLADCFKQDPEQRPESALLVAERLAKAYEILLSRKFPLSVPEEIELPARTLNNRALSLLELGKQSDAQRLLRSALEEHPESIELAYNSALMDLRAGLVSSEQAYRRVRAVYENFSRRWLANYALGLICTEHFDLDLENARVLLERANKPEVRREVTEALGHVETLSATVKHTLYEIPLEDLLASTDPERLIDQQLWDVSVSEACSRAVAVFTASPEVVLWDVRSNKITSRFSVSEDCHRAMLNPNGDLLAASIGLGGDRTGLEIYEVKSGTLLHRLPTVIDDPDEFRVVFSPTGSLMLCAFGKAVQVWDPYNGQLIADLKEHCESITSIAVAPDGKHLSSTSKDGAVRLWNLETFALQEQRMDTEAPPWAIGFARDGSFIVTAAPVSGAKDTVEFWIWDSNPLKRRRSLAVRGIQIGPAYLEGPDQIQVSANGKFLAYCGSIISLDSGRRFSSGTFDSSLHQIDGKELLLERSWDDRIIVSDITGLLTSTNIFHPPYLVGKVTATEDVAAAKEQFSTAMVVADVGWEMYHVKASWRPLVNALEVPGYERNEVASNLLYKLAQEAPRRRLWRAWPWHVLTGHTAYVEAVALDADGKLAISGSDDKTLRLWDVKSATCRAVFSDHTAPVADVCISRDGQLAASASHDATVRIWDTYSGKCISVCAGHTAGVKSVRLTSDGQRAVSGGCDGTVRIWDALSGKCLSVISVPRLYPYSADPVKCDIDADGKIALCVTRSRPWRVQVRNLNTGELLAELAGHEDEPRYGHLSTDGRLALTSSGVDLRVWEMETFHCSQIIHANCGRAVFSSDQDWIFGNSIKVFGVKDGSLRKTITHPAHVIFGDALALSNDGSLLVTTGEDHTVLCWQLVWVPEWEELKKP